MKKLLKFTAATGIIVGVVYLKRDYLFDKAFDYSKKIDAFLENIAALEKNSSQVKENLAKLADELGNSTATLEDLLDDLTKYGEQIAPILERISQKKDKLI